MTKKPYGIESLRVFQAGNLLEEYWVRVLEEHPDYEVLATQVPVYHYFDDWEIHGRADILTQHNRGYLVTHEVNSTRSLYYIRKDGRPRQEHLDQLNFYVVRLGLSYGQLDYLDKSALLKGDGVIDTSYITEADPTRFQVTVSKARKLVKALTDEDPPQPLPCWLCGYCLYKEECRKRDDKLESKLGLVSTENA